MFKINPWKLERMKRNFNESFSFTYLFFSKLKIASESLV